MSLSHALVTKRPGLFDYETAYWHPWVLRSMLADGPAQCRNISHRGVHRVTLSACSLLQLSRLTRYSLASRTPGLSSAEENMCAAAIERNLT